MIRRIRRPFRAIFLTLTGLVVVAYMLSGWYSLRLDLAQYSVTLDRGVLGVGHLYWTNSGTNAVALVVEQQRPLLLAPRFIYWIHSWYDDPIHAAWFVDRPIWPIPLLLALISISWLALTWRRRFPPGHCQKCGYDLRATPNRCPECGHTPSPGGTTENSPA